MERGSELRTRGGDQARAGRPRRRGLRLVVAVIGGAVLLILAAVGVAYALYGSDTNVSQRATGGGTKVIPVELSDFDVTPGTLIVDRGTHVVLEVTNTGDEDHDLVFDGGRLQTRTLGHGQSQQLDLGAVTRDLHGGCTLPFHDSLGMKLHIQVV
jgi:nitrite reductase (NO-forming)